MAEYTISKIELPNGDICNIKDTTYSAGTGLKLTNTTFKNERGIEYIRGTWTAATNVWTGTSTDSELYDGKQIILYMPFAGTSTAATLNLTLSGGGTTGAKNVYFESTTRFTTHKGQNSQLHLIYHKAQILSDGNTYEGWWYVANRDTSTTNATQIQHNFAVKAGSTAIVAGNIIVADSDGLYKHLKAGTIFDITMPIFYTSVAIAANSTATGNYSEINFTVTTTQSMTLTANLPVYIKGTLSGTKFTPISTAPLTQTVPTNDDGYAYIFLGMAYNATAIRLKNYHPIYMYKNNKFQLWLENSGATAGSYGDSSNQTPSYGSTFKVPYITVDNKGRVTGISEHTVKIPASDNTNTTYTFENGTNGFKVTPSGGTAQTVTVTPSITNNITGSGTDGYLAKFNGTNTITSGPQLGTDATKFLNNKGEWATALTSVAASGSGGISISGSPITTSGTITVGLNLSTAINGLGEGTSPAQLNDYLVAQYAGGGTTTTTYHRRKVSNVVNATVVKAALSTNATHSNQFLRKDGTWQTPPYPVTSVAGNTGAITADTLRTSLGLSNAMHFLGVTTTNISTGTANTTATVAISDSNVTAAAGDVVLYGSQEYVWGNDKWNLLGDESSYKVKQTAVNDPTAATTTSTTFIDTISQDANGVITATKKTLPTASTTVAGITKVGASGGAAAYSHNHDGAYVPMTSGANNVNTLVNTGIYNITSGSATNTPKGYGYGQLLTMAYRKHSGNTTTDWASQLYLHNGGGTEAGNTSAPGNVLYYRTSNSSSSNTWFSWQKAIHADADYAKIGSTTKGVYIDESGKVQEMSYTVSKNVPSDAVFTDTKNTAGSTNSASKLYLIGATSQAANPTTNSYQYTYTNNGLLSALKLGLNLNGTEKAHLEWNNTDQSIDFIFE